MVTAASWVEPQFRGQILQSFTGFVGKPRWRLSPCRAIENRVGRAGAPPIARAFGLPWEGHLKVMSKIYARPFVVASLALTLAVGTAGCQTLADLDPTGLIGGDDNSSAPDTQFPPDSQQQATQDANTTTPDLASLPARPAPPDATAQANTTQQVTTAGAQAQYSADALR